MLASYITIAIRCQSGLLRVLLGNFSVRIVVAGMSDLKNVVVVGARKQPVGPNICCPLAVAGLTLLDMTRPPAIRINLSLGKN